MLGRGLDFDHDISVVEPTDHEIRYFRAVEPRLWDMSTVLPILQDTTIVGAGPSVQNVSLSGAVPVGIVGDAGEWVKSAQ